MPPSIRHFGRLDWLLFLAIVTLLVIGILFIYSSGVTSLGEVVSNEYQKQIVWTIGSVILMIAATIPDAKRMPDYAGALYIINILLLLYTRLFGKVVNGARSWLGIGEFGIQPSEFMKITTMMFLARYLETSWQQGRSVKRFFYASLIILLPVTLILSQPDFGTALVFIPVFMAMVFLGGANRKPLLFMLLYGSLTLLFIILSLWEQLVRKESSMLIRILHQKPLVLYLIGASLLTGILSFLGYRQFKRKYYGWISFVALCVTLALLTSMASTSFLKDYQLMRLVVFLEPGIDPLGSGWHIMQSITAIGSGGIWGKGFLAGTQSHYRYLPEQSTDFIFSIISEELGFIGGFAIFMLYLFILLRLIVSMKHIRSVYQMTFISGVFVLILFHFLVNTGMAMGIMPITGIPLLFLSYGGSSLWAVSLGIGLALGIKARRFEI